MCVGFDDGGGARKGEGMMEQLAESHVRQATRLGDQMGASRAADVRYGTRSTGEEGYARYRDLVRWWPVGSVERDAVEEAYRDAYKAAFDAVTASGKG